MTRYLVGLHGRKNGAVGVMYELPPWQVEADTPREAAEKALLEATEKYEHLSALWVSLVGAEP